MRAPFPQAQLLWSWSMCCDLSPIHTCKARASARNGKVSIVLRLLHKSHRVNRLFALALALHGLYGTKFVDMGLFIIGQLRWDIYLIPPRFLSPSVSTAQPPPPAVNAPKPPPKSKPRRKKPKPAAKVPGALSLLVQYDSDSLSSCSTSDDSSVSSTGTISPVTDGREGQGPGDSSPPAPPTTNQRTLPPPGVKSNSRKRRSDGKGSAGNKKARKPSPQSRWNGTNFAPPVTSVQQRNAYAAAPTSHFSACAYSTNFTGPTLPGNPTHYSAAGVSNCPLTAVFPLAGHTYAAPQAFPPTTHAQYPPTFAQYGYYQWSGPGYGSVQYPSSYPFHTQNPVNSGETNSGSVYRWTGGGPVVAM